MTKHVSSILGVIAGLATTVASSTALAGSIYLGAWSTGTVWEVDLDTQAKSVVTSGFSLISGMEGIGNNDLYVFDQTTDRVTKVDPVTGTQSLFYNLSSLGINVTGEGTFAMNSDLTGFVSNSSGSSGNYWSFDLNANTAVNIGGGVSFDGVDYAPNGTLYGLTQGGSSLYKIDPVTAATTLVGNTGISGGSLAALVVADGNFIAAVNSSLYSIDAFTGAATFLFDPGIGAISGAAFLGSTNPGVVSEPGTLSLMLLGLLGLGRRTRKLVA